MISELLALVAIGLFAAAAAEDVTHRRIANRLVVALAVAALLRLAFGLATGAEDVTPLWDLAAAGAVFTAGVAAFHFGFVGGGDAKLLAAGALWTGAGSIWAFLFATALAGGVLALGFLAWAPRARARGIDASRIALPYGVAISAGGILATTGLV
jgi:prepilin peptidase CpaA